jgi:hypothetical protein
MKKILPILFAAVLATAFFLYASHAQMPEKGSKNTMTLPNGDVIWDLNADWDSYEEHYGAWSEFGPDSPILRIKQTGNLLEVTRLTACRWLPEGSIAFLGELDKNGCVRGTSPTSLGLLLDIKGQVSEDGSRIVIDDGVKCRMTYTRK